MMLRTFLVRCRGGVVPCVSVLHRAGWAGVSARRGAYTENYQGMYLRARLQALRQQREQAVMEAQQQQQQGGGQGTRHVLVQPRVSMREEALGPCRERDAPEEVEWFRQHYKLREAPHDRFPGQVPSQLQGKQPPVAFPSAPGFPDPPRLSVMCGCFLSLSVCVCVRECVCLSLSLSLSLAVCVLLSVK